MGLDARVSSEAQAEKYGPDAQLTAIRRRAAERGYEVVRDGEHEAFADDGHSAETLHRPSMEAMRRAARDGRLDVKLTYDPDRLARSLRDMLLLADEFEARGVRMEFITGEFDASPEGRLFFAIRGAVAEFEKAKIRERMMRGKREKADQGLVVTRANLPAWLRWDEGSRQVVLDAHWAEVLSLIFRLFVADGLTLRAVARRLTDLGYRTPSGGAHWQRTTVQAWLHNPAAEVRPRVRPEALQDLAAVFIFGALGIVWIHVAAEQMRRFRDQVVAEGNHLRFPTSSPSPISRRQPRTPRGRWWAAPPPCVGWWQRAGPGARLQLGRPLWRHRCYGRPATTTASDVA